ncbi:MAG: DUF4437 domain-containing protein [Acidobacteriota bacterium]
MLRRLVLVALAGVACTSIGQPEGPANPDRESPPGSGAIRVVSVVDVEWQALNPARGDMSPKAGTLWGDRNASVPTGFLAEFRDGFSSPPHIHNATYRAVVISGAVHNDDPSAEKMWMAPGSFWTQPRGEVHITAARGTRNRALVEIDRGPYLVKPPGEAFDSGERPVNIDVSNLVWLPLTQDSGEVAGVSISYLWGRHSDGESRGVFLRLSAGLAGVLDAAGQEFRGVVIQGALEHAASERELGPGSYFGSEGAAAHRVSAASGAKEVVVYIRSSADFRWSPLTARSAGPETD